MIYAPWTIKWNHESYWLILKNFNISKLWRWWCETEPCMIFKSWPYNQEVVPKPTMNHRFYRLIDWLVMALIKSWDYNLEVVLKPTWSICLTTSLCWRSSRRTGSPAPPPASSWTTTNDNASDNWPFLLSYRKSDFICRKFGRVR